MLRIDHHQLWSNKHRDTISGDEYQLELLCERRCTRRSKLTNLPNNSCNGTEQLSYRSFRHVKRIDDAAREIALNVDRSRADSTERRRVFACAHTSGRGENDSPGWSLGGFELERARKGKVEIAILCTERARGENLICTCAIVWRTLIG